MYCRNCGKELSDKAVMCVSCGNSPIKGEKFCSNCGAETDNDIEICTKCGVKLKSALSVKFLKENMSESLTTLWIDKLLALINKEHLSDFFEYNEKWLTKAGLYGLYACAVLGLILSLIFPIRYDISYGYSVGTGIVWFFLCIIVHYTACKFLPNIKNIINSTPTKLSSRAFLDSLSLLAGIGGVISLFAGFYFWAKSSSFEPLVIGLFTFIFCEYVVSLCLNPKIINIEITEKTTAGEEFIGLLSLFMKSFLKLIPIVFGSGIIIGCINLLVMFFMKFEYSYEITEKIFQIGSLTAAALLPITGYILFLVYYFFIDIATCILSIPSKLSELKKE